MSSHHVVREKQEPALLVLGLEDFSPECLGQLLEWSPTVIATPDTFDVLYSEDIKVDWLITADDNGTLQDNVKVISPGTQGYLSAALKELIEKNYAAVNIIANELQPEVFEHFGNKITIAMFCGNEKLFAVRSGYEKWLPADDVISIKQIPEGFKTNGLKEISTGQHKTIKDGIIRLEFDTATLLISEFIA